MTKGRLAIWNDCAPGHEAEYEAWYQGEHLVERLGVPGFRLGRRFRAIEGAPEYFTYYEVDAPEVLASPAYVERLENPTPATHRIMTQVFQNMNRTVCTLAASAGRHRGAFAVTSRLNKVPALPGISAPDIARVEAWKAAGTGPATSTEQRLRGEDDTIAACLLVETLTEEAARRVAETMPGEVGIYRLLCSLAAEP